MDTQCNASQNLVGDYIGAAFGILLQSDIFWEVSSEGPQRFIDVGEPPSKYTQSFATCKLKELVQQTFP